MSKLTWQQKQDIAFRAYRPYNRKMSVDVPRLRKDLFPSTNGRIPMDADYTAGRVVYNTRKEEIGFMRVMVSPSKSVGDRKTRGGRGHRLRVMCPACTGGPQWIPVGRLHQHYGYKHPVK